MSELDRLRRLVSRAGSAEESRGEVARLEAAISKRAIRRETLLREAEHLRRRVDLLQTEAQALDGEVAGLEKALEALCRDIADRHGLDVEQWWSPAPFIGYRAWIIKKDGLHGARVRWTSRHLTAGCLGTSADSEVPHANGECGSPPCGIYATKGVDTLFRFFGGGMLREVALGLVSLTGRVVDHELGYRAARAEVKAVTVVSGPSLLATAIPEVIDQVFTSTRDEVGRMCRASDRPLEEAVAYLEEQARRTQTWTSAAN